MGRRLENLAEAAVDAAVISLVLFTVYVGAALIVGAA